MLRWPGPEYQAIPRILKAWILAFVDQLVKHRVNIEAREIWGEEFGLLLAISSGSMGLVAQLDLLLVEVRNRLDIEQSR